MSRVAKHGATRFFSFDLVRLVKYALDVWRVDRGGAELIKKWQDSRLAKIVAFARAQSSFYRSLYETIGPDVTRVEQLPVVTKTELMADFDRWVTDRAITKRDLDEFVADREHLGDLFLKRYVVWATWGTTTSDCGLK